MIVQLCISVFVFLLNFVFVYLCICVFVVEEVGCCSADDCAGVWFDDDVAVQP